jgi:hypothetical protein
MGEWMRGRGKEGSKDDGWVDGWMDICMDHTVAPTSFSDGYWISVWDDYFIPETGLYSPPKAACPLSK